MQATRKLFTPAQANRTLPYVRRIVRDVLEHGRELRAQPADRAERDRLLAELQGLMVELERVGCSYKDWSFDTGLVDFPAEIDGHPVLLCWRSDEDAITWYHPADAGYAARKKIPPALLADSPPQPPDE